MAILVITIGLIAITVLPPILFLKMIATYNPLLGCAAILGFVGWFLFFPLVILNGIRLILAG